MLIKTFIFYVLCIYSILSTLCIIYLVFYVSIIQNEKMKITQELLTKLTETTNKNKLIASNKHTAKVTLTAYCPWEQGINSDKDATKTAIMTKPVSGWTCALSTALVRKGWLGKKIYIEGYGVFKAEDRMSSSLEGERIDLCIGTLEDAYKIGKNENVFVSCLIGEY